MSLNPSLDEFRPHMPTLTRFKWIFLEPVSGLKSVFTLAFKLLILILNYTTFVLLMFDIEHVSNKHTNRRIAPNSR